MALLFGMPHLHLFYLFLSGYWEKQRYKGKTVKKGRKSNRAFSQFGMGKVVSLISGKTFQMVLVQRFIDLVSALKVRVDSEKEGENENGRVNREIENSGGEGGRLKEYIKLFFFF